MHLSTLVETAARLRSRSGQRDPSYSTRKIIKACFPTAIVTGRQLPDGIDEVVSIAPSEIVILYQRSLSTPAQRFAIAHALGHVVFDRREGACRPGCVGEPEREVRADRFAAELLAPMHAIGGHVECWPAHNDNAAESDRYLDQVDRIASFFRVPAAVIDQQIRTLRAS